MQMSIKLGSLIQLIPLKADDLITLEIFYGYPDGPVDDEKYAIGGCCISDNDPSIKCVDCGWKGEYVNNIDRSKR